jgi:hypothetical protein
MYSNAKQRFPCATAELISPCYIYTSRRITSTTNQTVSNQSKTWFTFNRSKKKKDMVHPPPSPGARKHHSWSSGSNSSLFLRNQTYQVCTIHISQSSRASINYIDTPAVSLDRHCLDGSRLIVAVNSRNYYSHK